VLRDRLRPQWGQYTQADPIGLSGGINLFAYGAANPVTYIDQLGLVCGITVWDEEVTYDVSLKNWKNGFKNTYGHKWIEYPGGSMGFWPGVSTATISNPFAKVPGKVQSPDSKTKTPHSTQYTKSETYYQLLNPKGECVSCAKTLACLKKFAQTYTCEWSLIGGDNCKTFVDDAMQACGLTTLDYESQVFIYK
jgi:hypothetical protein